MSKILTKVNISDGIVIAGNPACQHRELVATNENKHLIGRCLLCSRMKDYTVLHNQLPEMKDGYVRPFTMNEILKTRKGGQKRKGFHKRMVNQ